MSNPAFILANGNLTFDAAFPSLSTDEPHVSYGLKAPVPPPPRPGRRFGSAPVGGRGCFGGTPRKRPVRPDGTEADKEPSFAETAVELLHPGKGRERRPKTRPPPEREAIYDLRARLARIRETVARLDAERRRLVQATEERRAEHRAEVQVLLLQVVALEHDLLSSERDRAALLVAMEAERDARARGAILVGAGLGAAGLTLAAIPPKYAWMGYTAAAGLALWGLLELVLPVGPQPAQGVEPVGARAKEEALAH
jgi:hypothetical protein